MLLFSDIPSLRALSPGKSRIGLSAWTMSLSFDTWSTSDIATYKTTTGAATC